MKKSPELGVLSPRHPRSPWTADRIAYLRKRWSQGVSASRIAAELGAGISRTAVLGKLHRLGSAHSSPAARSRPAPSLGAAVFRSGHRSRHPAVIPLQSPHRRIQLGGAGEGR
jgi:GcrA cell cycle regulator